MMRDRLLYQLKIYSIDISRKKAIQILFLIVPDGIQCLFQTYQFYLQDNSVNLILMDQNMPFLSGSVICSLIKSIRELDKTAIYLITSEDYRDNLCKEANGIYSKPLKFSDIENILHEQFFD